MTFYPKTLWFMTYDEKRRKLVQYHTSPEKEQKTNVFVWK